MAMDMGAACVNLAGRFLPQRFAFPIGDDQFATATLSGRSDIGPGSYLAVLRDRSEFTGRAEAVIARFDDEGQQLRDSKCRAQFPSASPIEVEEWCVCRNEAIFAIGVASDGNRHLARCHLQRPCLCRESSNMPRALNSSISARPSNGAAPGWIRKSASSIARGLTPAALKPSANRAA